MKISSHKINTKALDNEIEIDNVTQQIIYFQGGTLSKSLCTPQDVTFSCVSHTTENMILHQEIFKDMRHLLFDAVGFNVRDF